MKTLRDSGSDLSGVKVRIPNEHKKLAWSVGLDTMEVYLVSVWAKGVWVKTDMESTRIYPLTILDIESVLDWEIVD